MLRSTPKFLDRLTYGLLALFALDRFLKLAAVMHFFRRPQPPLPAHWPTVTLLQPITRGASCLNASLRSRAQLDYPAAIQHLLICDTRDNETQALLTTFLAEFPELQASIVTVDSDTDTAVATKITKLQVALPQATGDVLCFVDDDVALRPRTLQILIPYLFQPGVGVAFGLPCFTNWQSTWSSLVSGLINAQMLLNFVAMTYITRPIRINGHIYAFRRDIFQAIEGLDGLERTIDDEYEIARRVRSHKLHAAQTPLVYEIDNALHSRKAYTTQFKRWFVMPRQAMLPSLSAKERAIASITSVTFPLPSMIALLALCTGRRSAWISLAVCLSLFGTVYTLCEKRYLKRQTPLYRWPLLPIVALWTPLQIIWTLLLSNEVEWRGQRLRLLRDGTVEIIAPQ